MSDRLLSLTQSKTFNLFSFVFKHLAESLIKVVQSLNYRIAILDQINQISYIESDKAKRTRLRPSTSQRPRRSGRIEDPPKLERTERKLRLD